MENAWVALHIACHVQFTVTSLVTLVTLYITIVFQLYEDQRTVEMNSKQRAIWLQMDER